MHRASRILVLLLTIALTLVPVLSAHAADKPQPWKAIDVVVHTEDGSNLLIVSGELPESAKLPATVELAIPAGSELQWAGEILGGEVSADPSVEYTVSTRDGSDIYTFTLTKARTGQIEVVRPDLIIPSAAASQASLTYSPAGDVGELRMKYRLPQTAKVEQPAEGAVMNPGPTGFSYYERIVKNAKAGEPQSLAFTFSGSAAAPAPATPAAAGTSGSNSVVLFLVLGLSAAALVLLGMGVYKKMQLKASDNAGPAPAPKSAAKRLPSNAAAKATKAVAQTDSTDESAAPAGTPSAAAKKRLAIGVITVAFVGAALFAVNASRGGVQTGDTVEMTYAQVDTCTTSNIGLTAPSGGDLTTDKTKVLEALRTVSGVGNATLHLNESRIEVRYCDSSVQEPAILSALSGTGYTAAPLAAAAEEVAPAPEQPQQ
ncbi:MAG TPA: hypothetical protein VLA05_12545 [Coriobacteriia bacterium]|nr:hypothetical protein [Coriobacteriia bacterium]